MFARVVVGSVLHSELELAIRRYERAQRDFAAAISLSWDNPDRPRHIKQTAENEGSARNELWLALERLDDFNVKGIVPEIEAAAYPPRGFSPVCTETVGG